MELSEVTNHLVSDNCFLFQRVECEYERFGCAVVLPRKDVAEHLKTSVQAHLQMTMRRVEEQEVRLQEETAERNLMKEKMHKMNTLMGWLLIYLPILLVVFMLISYHQGLLSPIVTIILSCIVCFFIIIHSCVLYM